jgi:hypothetical protein
MSLIVDNKIVDNHLARQELDNTNQGPISSLPDELVMEIFSNLNLATLGTNPAALTICHVSKAWKRLASEPILWKIAIYREIAFGNDKWAKHFGKDVVKNEDSREEFLSLPLNIVEDYKRFQSAFPKENAKDSLMLVRLPKTLNGQLTLKSLGELAKKYFSHSDTGYGYIWPAVIDELGDKSIDKSRWVLMTKDILPGSRNKNYAEQKDIVANLAQKGLIGYEIPETLEAAVCILAQYVDSNIRLFSDDCPRTFTRCKENVPDHNYDGEGRQVAVGGFAPAGLVIGDTLSDYIGVAALRKL